MLWKKSETFLIKGSVTLAVAFKPVLSWLAKHSGFFSTYLFKNKICGGRTWYRKKTLQLIIIIYLREICAAYLIWPWKWTNHFLLDGKTIKVVFQWVFGGWCRETKESFYVCGAWAQCSYFTSNYSDINNDQELPLHQTCGGRMVV